MQNQIYYRKRQIHPSQYLNKTEIMTQENILVIQKTIQGGGVDNIIIINIFSHYRYYYYYIPY